MSDPLKSCPFCGGEAKFDFDAFGHIRVICVACGARSKSYVTSFESVEKDAEDIAATWNRRADIASIRHAKWVQKYYAFRSEYDGRLIESYDPFCSACDSRSPGLGKYRFCPNCGARMDEKEESE